MWKRILTGLKPTSAQLHLGNYFGAVKPLFELAKAHPDAEVFFMIVSMHAFTTLHDAEAIRTNTWELSKLYLAMMRNYGLSDDALMVYNQADVMWLTDLTWVFSCLTHMGFMERMHAYKDAVAKKTSSEVSVWTFVYPILMAMDVIAYDINYVPVGKDQKQHIEYARDIAQKFNSKYGETFVLPEPMISENVATVPWIDGRKMSKSYNNFIGLLDDKETVIKKIKRIPTNAIWIEEPKNPDEDNIYNIARLFLNEEEDKKLRARYEDGGLSYKVAKEELVEIVRGFIEPIQTEYNAIDEDYLKAMLDKNGQYAKSIVQAKVADVYKKVGFTL